MQAVRHHLSVVLVLVVVLAALLVGPAPAGGSLHLPSRDLWRKSSVWRLVQTQHEYPQHRNEFTTLGKPLEGSRRRKPHNPHKVRIAQSSHYELKYTLGRKIVFICVARGNPRPQITWFKDGIELYAHNFFKVHEWQIGKRKFKSKMEIDPATPMDVGFYECVADNYHSVDVRGFRTEYTASIVLESRAG
ncbi:immunoglobulin domain-containing protein oig-4-like isoform X2 [Amphibalanus amphitrite]|uniref:immunoglobulin domain-containing protein oig-4-like isoform X2 n=1 Tax=Amphibalanus amphitrite TaxID=1232801 RepID=UPI001C912C63|nr:immunoglobulin domain-containing protein oig-4-like isoform X2 [Amphibalanus amphitrite]XP_043236668.1 immunoglobulin domain-containing protein oig-4-like isoform X2 [Amphibalanus amphitrite]